jgi:electron transport complex protein RnfA
MEYVIIIISAVFVNNIVLIKFLGICPFIGVSNKVDTSIGMTGAVTFVMVIATIVTYLLQVYVLEPLNITFMQTITFILVIASLVQMVEIMLKKVSPSLYEALGIFLPLITTNCAVLGVAVLAVQNDYNLLESVVFAIGNAIGFGIALIVFAGIREQLELVNVPDAMKGVPIAFVVAGLLALAFLGFSGILFSNSAGTTLALTVRSGRKRSPFLLAPPPKMIRSGLTSFSRVTRYLSKRFAHSSQLRSSAFLTASAAYFSASIPINSIWPNSVFGTSPPFTNKTVPMPVPIVQRSTTPLVSTPAPNFISARPAASASFITETGRPVAFLINLLTSVSIQELSRLAAVFATPFCTTPG